jgi:hypothetical protein
MIFHINNKAYTVAIDDSNEALQNGIKKYVDLNKNLETSELLLAYIKKSYELVQLENSLENLSIKIDDITLKD